MFAHMVLVGIGAWAAFNILSWLFDRRGKWAMSKRTGCLGIVLMLPVALALWALIITAAKTIGSGL